MGEPHIYSKDEAPGEVHMLEVALAKLRMQDRCWFAIPQDPAGGLGTHRFYDAKVVAEEVRKQLAEANGHAEEHEAKMVLMMALAWLGEHHYRGGHYRGGSQFIKEEVWDEGTA